MTKRVKASKIVGELTVPPIDKDLEVTDAFFLFKCSDRSGEIVWSFRKTEGMSNEELLGALEIQRDLAARTLLSVWDEDGR